LTGGCGRRENQGVNLLPDLGTALRTVAPIALLVGAGVAARAAGVRLPQPVERPLHMLGTTTATVSFFMLGAMLYGRRFRHGCASGRLRSRVPGQMARAVQASLPTMAAHDGHDG